LESGGFGVRRFWSRLPERLQVRPGLRPAREAAPGESGAERPRWSGRNFGGWGARSRRTGPEWAGRRDPARTSLIQAKSAIALGRFRLDFDETIVIRRALRTRPRRVKPPSRRKIWIVSADERRSRETNGDRGALLQSSRLPSWPRRGCSGRWCREALKERGGTAAAFGLNAEVAAVVPETSTWRRAMTSSISITSSAAWSAPPPARSGWSWSSGPAGSAVPPMRTVVHRGAATRSSRSWSTEGAARGGGCPERGEHCVSCTRHHQLRTTLLPSTHD
jgi:hypothetical protein